MMKSAAYFITTTVSELIKNRDFRNYLSKNYGYFELDLIKKNQTKFEKLETISVSLVGDVVENFIRLKFSLQNKDEIIAIKKGITDSIKRYEEFYQNVLNSYYEDLDKNYWYDNWIIYSDEDYDLVIDSLQVNTAGYAFYKTSITKKEVKHGDIVVIEEKGYCLIKAGDYYGNIISMLLNFEQTFNQILSDNNFEVFENIDVLKSFILFSHVATKPQWLKISKHKKNIGFYSTEDLNKILIMLRSIPKINYTASVKSHPTFHTYFKDGEFEGRLFATPDFICNNRILEIKASQHASKNDFYQILMYFVLSRTKENILEYGKLYQLNIKKGH